VSVAITFLSSVAYRLLPTALRLFRELCPEVHLTLTEATTGAQVKALLEDQSDLGILTPPFQDGGRPSLLQLEVLKEDGLLVAMPSSHRLAKRKSIELSEFADDPWILCPAHEGPGLYARVMDSCLTAGFTPKIVQEALQMETMVGLVAGGIGIALVPRAFAEVDQHNIAYRKLVGRGTPVLRILAACYRFPSPAVLSFIAALKKSANQEIS
jgi:DNA-binding transcriptional LysR family regulator